MTNRKPADLSPIADADTTARRKADASAWFETLRDRICAAFEALEDAYDGPGATDAEPGRFERKPWARPDDGGDKGGGGVMSVMRGRVFEKVGVNVSTVEGRFSDAFAAEIPGASEDPRFWASGVSLVAHLHNPHAPAAHMNTRHIVTTRWWFGGGGDLNPAIEYDDDTAAFHNGFKIACDARGPGVYDDYKAWCDDYFFIKHRNEPRGVGGVFYDYVSKDWDADFAFTRSIGEAFLNSYPPLVGKRMHTPWTDEDKERQLFKRGRYAEFNLVYDRGTRFGLMTGGNPEAVLMSLPPIAKWP
ncbi:MAG: oxygen-dependent coproporphyrinogen oxidase [Pseudomonadota bacterium]